MILVNLFGEPGAGKSTGAAYIFSQLKIHGVNAELVTEYAKDKVWEENTAVFKNQAYIFGKQFFKISRCEDKVDVIVTDSPLPLSIIYNENSNLTENFNKTVMDVFNSYNNINFLILRTKPYNPSGRHQDEQGACELKDNIRAMLHDRGIKYGTITGDVDGYDTAVREILGVLEEEFKNNRKAESNND